MRSGRDPTPSRGPVRSWLIIGHYGGSNTGDEAMLMGLLAGGRAFLGPDTAVLTKERALPMAAQQGDLDTVAPALVEVVAALRRSDGLILGGGTHFHDDYVLPRYLRHLRYLARLVAVSALAKAVGRPVLWLGMGFGPLYRAPTRWLTRIGLRTCDFVTVRDRASRDEVRRWIREPRLDQTFDLAALLLDQDPAVAEAPRADTVLGVSVTSAARSLEAGSEIDRRLWSDFSRALQRLYGERPELRVEIFVFRGGSREDDRELSGGLWRLLRSTDPERVVLHRYQPDPLETLRAVGACSAFVATRYHAAVLAYLAGCRLCCVRYHRKVGDFVREVGLAEAACVDPGHASEELLYQRLGSLLGRDPAFRAKLPTERALSRARRNLEILARFSAR